MPERSLLRAASVKGYATPTAAPIYVNSADNTLKLVPAGSGTTEVAVLTAVQASGSKVAAGSGSFVSGAATVNTGLTSVLGFSAVLNGPTGFATGATEISHIIVSSITTGAVVLKGVFNAFVTGAATISASGTGGFLWTAVGV